MTASPASWVVQRVQQRPLVLENDDDLCARICCPRTEGFGLQGALDLDDNSPAAG